MQHPIRDTFVLVAGYLIASGTLVGQSRDDLVRKCGQPRSETFVIRPGVEVSATYAENGRTTELLIAPATRCFVKSRGSGLSLESVNAVIDELVPLATRGKYLIGEFINMDCLPANDCRGSSSTYEKVAIYYNAAPEGRVYYAVVSWNDKVIRRVAGGTLIGQSRDELRRKYGDPVSETFRLRPGVSVTATYAANGRIMELLISPEAQGFIKSQSLGRLMSQDLLRALVDELLPGSVRGKFVIGGLDDTAGCLPTDVCGGSFEKYEKATIFYKAGTDRGVSFAVVTLKE